MFPCYDRFPKYWENEVIKSLNYKEKFNIYMWLFFNSISGMKIKFAKWGWLCHALRHSFALFNYGIKSINLPDKWILHATLILQINWK